MGVTVKVPVQSSDSSVVTLMSYNQDAVNETVRLMADLIGFYPLKEDLCEVTFQLAGQHIGKLIGSGGSTMHDIQRCCCCGIETPARGNQNNEPVRIQVPQSKVKKLMDRLQYELGFLPEYSERSLAEYSVGGKFDSKENEKETQQEQNTSRKRKRSSDEKKDLKQNKKIKLQKPIVIDDTEWKKEFDNSSTLINQFQTTQMEIIKKTFENEQKKLYEAFQEKLDQSKLQNKVLRKENEELKKKVQVLEPFKEKFENFKKQFFD